MTSPTVDIIVPVHNAPHLTTLCLDSVIRTRDPDNHRIILVDDGSGSETREVLEKFLSNNQNTVLNRNRESQGFTKAANSGLREVKGEMAVILNSDTQVPPMWIEKIAKTLFGTPGVGIAGPLSNAASYQSIPRTEPHATERLHRQTVINQLPPGMNIGDVNRFLELIRWDHPIRVPLIHGFCFAVQREVINEIGFFDEINFPRGFGEENDYCFRAADAGWGLAISPDTYVWHEKTGSYSQNTRAELVTNARHALISKYGKKRIETATRSLRSTSEYLRSRIGEMGRE